jgi:putative FmdB family regulatory protein
MPTYVYRCRKGHTFELFHSISDETPKRCPECRSLAKRIPAGGSGLLFKGSGFYITDYRSKGYKESAKQESGTKPDKAAPAGPAAGGASGAPAAPASGGSQPPAKGKSERPSQGSPHGPSPRRKPEK